MSHTRLAFYLGFLVLGLILMPSSFLPVQAQTNAPLVRIDPVASENLPVGSNFTIYVWVDNAVGLEAAQVQFTYDSTALNVTNIAEGPFLQSIDSIVSQISSKAITDALSEVAYSAAGTSGNTASGSGILLNVTFTVISEGSSSFHLITFVPGGTYPGTYFEDINLNNIVPSLQDGFYGSPITFAASDNLITIGDSVTLNGTLSGLAGANITEIGLQYKSLSVVGAPFVNLTSLLVDTSHNFSYQWTSNATGTFEFAAFYSSDNKTHSSPLVEVVVQPSLHGYGLYVEYAIIGLVVFIAVISIIVPIRSRRKKALEKPPT